MKPLDLINWALQVEVDSKPQNDLLLYLAIRQGGNTSCNPKMKTILKHMHIKSENTIYVAKKALIKRGLISFADGVYFVHATDENAALKATPQVENATPEVVYDELDTTPQVKNTTPRVEITTPRVEITTPRVEGTTLRVEETTPRVEITTPEVVPYREQTINRQLTDIEQTPPISPTDENHPDHFDLEIVEQTEPVEEQYKLVPMDSKQVTTVDVAFAQWNAFAETHGRPKAKHITPARKAAMKARLKDLATMNETWESFLEKLRKSDWHMGLSGWKAGADIDWLLKTANFVKIIEREDHGNDKHSGRNGRNPSGGEITQNSGTKPISIFDQLAAKAVQRGRQLDGFGTKSNIPSGGKEWAIDENRPA